MSFRHKRAGLNGLELFMYVTYVAGVPTLSRASGESFGDADISFTDTGTGDALVTIVPFKGPIGEIYAQATAFKSTGANVQIGAITYTGDSVAIQVLGFDLATPTATDVDFMLHVYAE